MKVKKTLEKLVPAWGFKKLIDGLMEGEYDDLKGFVNYSAIALYQGVAISFGGSYLLKATEQYFNVK